jgi:hypothetical protein
VTSAGLPLTIATVRSEKEKIVWPGPNEPCWMPMAGSRGAGLDLLGLTFNVKVPGMTDPAGPCGRVRPGMGAHGRFRNLK